MSFGQHRTQLFLCALVGALLFAFLLSMSSGQYDIPMAAVVASFAHAAGLPFFTDVVVTPEQEAVLWHIRLPRTLVGMMVGAGLGVSGAVLQGIFSNPLADPGIIGVSSGASVGAVLAIGIGVTAGSVLTLPAFAFTGAILAVGLTVSLSMRRGRIRLRSLGCSKTCAAIISACIGIIFISMWRAILICSFRWYCLIWPWDRPWWPEQWRWA